MSHPYNFETLDGLVTFPEFSGGWDDLSLASTVPTGDPTAESEGFNNPLHAVRPSLLDFLPILTQTHLVGSSFVDRSGGYGYSLHPPGWPRKTFFHVGC